jgi:hypothetical protein
MNTGSFLSRGPIVGVFFDDSMIYGCAITGSRLGAHRQNAAKATVEGDDWGSALTGLLRQLGVSQSSVPIYAAFPAAECFVATKMLTKQTGLPDARLLLQETCRVSAETLHSCKLDFVRTVEADQQLFGVAAAPQATVARIRDAVEQAGHRIERLVFDVDALVRSACIQDRNRYFYPVVRLFVGDAMALATVSVGDRVIGWQPFPLSEGNERSDLRSLVKLAASIALDVGFVRRPNEIFVHSSGRFRMAIDESSFETDWPTALFWRSTPELSERDVASGCAQLAFQRSGIGFDFSKRDLSVQTPKYVHRSRTTIALTAAAALTCGVALHLTQGAASNERDQQHASVHSTSDDSKPSSSLRAVSVQPVRFPVSKPQPPTHESIATQILKLTESSERVPPSTGESGPHREAGVDVILSRLNFQGMAKTTRNCWAIVNGKRYRVGDTVPVQTSAKQQVTIDRFDRGQLVVSHSAGTVVVPKRTLPRSVPPA